MKKIVAVALMLLCGFASAIDTPTPGLYIHIYTPVYLYNLATKADIYTAESAYIEIASISAGMLSAVLTVQDLGLAPRAVCIPIRDGKPSAFYMSLNLYQAIRTVDPYAFPATNQGGAMFVYTAMVKAYPCR